MNASLLDTLGASWLPILITFAAIFIIKVWWRYVKLWVFFKDMKKKGAETYFSFPAGIFGKLDQDTKTGDVYQWFKTTIQHNPDARMIATHMGSQPALFFIEPKLIKAILSENSKIVK